MNANQSYIEAISFVAPGLQDWHQTRSVLCGESAYQAAEIATYQPNLLPPNERRRASPTVRMAFRIAEELVKHSSVTADQLASVFSSSDGDLAIAQRICAALAESPRMVSPTDFHNSVHNAAAGYWSIAANAKGPSTAVSAFDQSFAVGLLEAQCMVHVEGLPTLLVVYDVPAPAPLQSSRSVSRPVGMGLLLTPQPTTNSIATLRIEIENGTETCMHDNELETLRLSNPAARALTLLHSLAKSFDPISVVYDDTRCVKITLQSIDRGVHS